MRERATRDAVREAYDLLGEDATLTKLQDITGGSRSTVLKHRRAIIEERNAAGIPEPVRGFLHQQTKPMIERLWKEALALASQSFEERAESMITVQAELIEALRKAQAGEAEALKRATSAEDLVKRLRLELTGRKSTEQQMAALANLVRTRMSEDGAEEINASAGVRPIEKLLALLQPRPMHPRDYRRHMKDAGYTSKQASQALAEATARAYIVSDDDSFVGLTELGVDRKESGPGRRHA